MNDMFDDAFNAIARDGAGTMAIAVRLQKAFNSLSSLDDERRKETPRTHGRLALRYAEESLILDEEINLLRKISSIVSSQEKSKS